MKKQTIVVAVLCVLCAIPAMVIGYVNRPMLTTETLSKPFKQPKESGAAYTEKTPVETPSIDEALTIPEVVVNGVASTAKNSGRAADKKAQVIIETPELSILGTNANEEEVSTVETGGAAWMQDSLVGGTVKITGFQPGE